MYKNIITKFHGYEITHNGKDNRGQYKQKYVDFALTGMIRENDRVPYNMGSDIEEYGVSVKSEKFTLMSGGLCNAQDFDGIIAEYFSNTASDTIAYVDKNLDIYIMTNAQFEQFLISFAVLARESKRNGGRYKVRMRSESRKVQLWLNELA